MFSWQQTLRKCYPPDFKFYPSKFTNKQFPHKVLCQIFFAFFVLPIAVKTDSKLTFHHIKLTEIKSKIWRVTILKSVLPQRNYGMDFWFSGNNRNIECALRRYEL